MKRWCVFFILILMLLPTLVLADGGQSEAVLEKKLEVEELSIELGVILNIRIREQNCKMAGYYFGNIDKQPAAKNHDWLAYTDTYLRTTKFPGNYYLWLRDTEGNMYGPTYVEMPQIYNTYFRMDNTEFPEEAISTYLPKYCNYSVEELNELIAENVAKAGIYTREAVVVGITTQFSKLQEFGIRIPFFFYGYWPVREYGWYLNPDWGTTYDLNTKAGLDIWTGKKKAEHEMGTHCNGFVHYAFRLAGLNVRNTGTMGETGDIGGVGALHANRVGTYEGRPGDVLQGVTKPNHHEMIIIDRYDDDMDGESDGYIVAESNDDEGGQVYCKKKFATYAKYCKVFNMDGVYYNTATQQWMLKFWNNYHIPVDAMPEFLQTAVRKHSHYTVAFEDAQGIRTVQVPFQGTLDEAPEIRGLFEGHTLGAHWSEDVTGKPLERNYVVHAVYEINDPADVPPPQETPQATAEPEVVASPVPTAQPAAVTGPTVTAEPKTVFEGERRKVALTFDDGPREKNTSNVLDVLEQYGAKATFFVLGIVINEETTPLLQRMVDLGCEIGIHGKDHGTMTGQSLKYQLNRLNGMKELLDTSIQGGYTPRLMRPPGGNTNGVVEQAARETGLSIILWSVDSQDWLSADPNAVLDLCRKQITDGSIVLFHDKLNATRTAVETLVPWLLEQGYELVTVSELLESRGTPLEPGKVYRCLE